MSYDDYDDETQNDGPKALRDLVDKLKRDNAKLTEENSKFAAKAKAADLATVFTKLSVPPKIQRWIKDVDSTEEAVQKWLDENGEDFGYQPASAQTDSVQTPEGEQSTSVEAPATAVPSVLSLEDIATFERLQGLLNGSTGQTVLSDQVNTSVATVESKLGPDASFDEVVSELRAQGIDIESAR